MVASDCGDARNDAANTSPPYPETQFPGADRHHLERQCAMPSVSRPAARSPDADLWRHGVQSAMLTVAAFVAPPIVVATIVFRSGSWTLIDQLAIGSVGI